MSTKVHSHDVTCTPIYHQTRPAMTTSLSSAQAVPLRQPPTVYLGQQVYDPSSQPSQINEHQKREHGSISSTSTDSFQQNAALQPRPDPIHIYSNSFSLTSQAESSSLETPRVTRAYPNQYTRPSRSEMAEINAAYYHSHAEDDSSETSADHAIWIVMWLSLLDPLYCILAALYTFLILLPILLFTPLHLCQPPCDSPSSTVRLISPILRRHLKILCTESSEESHDFNYKPLLLIMVYLAAPILSFGVSIAAWVSAWFWIFAITMGNPDGTERKDDGRATVLAVRNWWERYLLSAVR